MIYLKKKYQTLKSLSNEAVYNSFDNLIWPLFHKEFNYNCSWVIYFAQI